MPAPLPIRGSRRSIGDGKPFVVAEIGKNFITTGKPAAREDDLAAACRLIDEAAAAGADAAKFQTHVVEDEQLEIPVTSPHFEGNDRHAWVKRNADATPPEFWSAVSDRCRKKNIVFFSTPMSRLAAQRLAPLDPPLWKVGSADVTDRVLLSYLVSTGKPIIVSTGMVSLRELDDTVNFLRGSPLVVLYCVSKYPCPREDFNLSTIARLKQAYPDVHVGFSDHSIGPEASFAAVKLGATVIEKHFSMSRDAWGPDHKVSMTPAELRELVKGGDAEPKPFLGDPDAELEGATNRFRPVFRKALMAGRDLPVGTALREDMIYAMRPLSLARGLPAERLGDVLGRRTRRALKKFEPLNADTVEVLVG